MVSSSEEKLKIKPKQKSKAQQAQTCIWCINLQEAAKLQTKMREKQIPISAHVEYNLLILKKDLDNVQYKVLYSSKV